MILCFSRDNYRTPQLCHRFRQVCESKGWIITGHYLVKSHLRRGQLIFFFGRNFQRSRTSRFFQPSALFHQNLRKLIPKTNIPEESGNRGKPAIQSFPGSVFRGNKFHVFPNRIKPVLWLFELLLVSDGCRSVDLYNREFRSLGKWIASKSVPNLTCSFR